MKPHLTAYDGWEGKRAGTKAAAGPEGTAFTIKTFVGGYFVDNFTAPCNEDTAASSPNATCKNWKTKQDALYQHFFGEPYRTAIRKAIATWPKS